MANKTLPLPAASLLKTNIFNERYLYTVNRDTFLKVSAKVIFDAEFKKSIFKEDSLYIIVGTDSGLLPKYIQQHGIPSGTRYIFIEPDHILTELYQHHLLNDIAPEIIFTTHDKWQENAEKLKIEQYSYLSAIHLLSAICAQQNSSEDYDELNWEVSESLQSIHWKYSVRLSTELFIIRQIENVAEAQIPAKLLENTFQDQTAIILAGGPSLDDILPWIKKNRGCLTVFSVSRISKQLLAADITPDFICSVDPKKGSLDIAHEMFSFNDQPIFIHAYHAYPGLLNQWHGKSLYLGNRLPWKSPLNINNLQSTGPTVTNTAISTAYYFGFETILLAGVDLCYSKEGITHLRGSAEQLAGPKYNTTSLQVETYSGEYRGTSEDYFFALQTIAYQAQSITKNNKKVINLGKNAAKAEGIIHISPEEIKLTRPLKTANTIAHEKITCSERTFNQTDYYSEVINELTKAKHQIREIGKHAKKANQINATMYSSNGIIENYKDKKRLDKIEKTLSKKHRIYSNLVKNFGVRQFIKISSPHDDERIWEAEKAQEIGKTYYDAYESGANTLSNIINTALVRTKSRQEELKETPDFQLLFKQWNKDHSYNRASLWLKKHPNSVLSAEINKEFLLFSKKFTDYTKEAFSGWQAKMKKKNGNIHSFKNKAKILFKHKQYSELVRLKETFLSDSKNNNRKDYLLLISAYIAELEHDNDSALENYHQIINIDDTDLLEDALNRITSISIEQNNHKNAFLALECLAQLSPIYLPYYAESARLLGETLLAIDSYTAYINAFPEDVVTQLKLASLYISLKIYDAAELMLEHILQQSPDLKDAIILKQQLKQQ